MKNAIARYAEASWVDRESITGSARFRANGGFIPIERVRFRNPAGAGRNIS